MNFLRDLIRRRPSTMKLEAEGQLTIENPSEALVRAMILGLQQGGSTFASLTDEAGITFRSRVADRGA